MEAATEPFAGDVAVSCRGVVKSASNRAGHTPILRGVDLDLRAGELTLLVGPSGCGKTTLISTMAGVLPIDEGSIGLFGTDLGRLGRTALVRFRGANIGIAFQKANLFPALTATENVAVPLLVQGMGSSNAHSRARNMLDEVGLGAHGGKYPSELSVGEQQRVAIARALVHGPRLVICDEPTAALDTASGSRVMHLLRHVALRPDRAVVVVTHDNRIVSFADRIAQMNDGRITTIETCSNREAA
jgi:putative ABC transport system ATP-binding protein